MKLWTWLRQAFCAHVYVEDIVFDEGGLYHTWLCQCGAHGRRLIGVKRI